MKRTKLTYAQQLDNAIAEYELMKPYPQHRVSWITDRIVWCWQFRKITEDEKDDFCERMTAVLKRGIYD